MEELKGNIAKVTMTMTGKIRYKIGPLGLLGQVKDVCCFSIHNKIVWTFDGNSNSNSQRMHSSAICAIHGLTIVKWCNRKKADVLSSKRNKNKQS